MTPQSTPPATPEVSPKESHDPQDGQEFRRQRRTKNWVLFAVLVAFVVVVYFVSLIRMGGG